MHLLMLSGENLKLARLEAESLLGLDQTRLEGNYLFCTIPTESMKLIDRLAYTRRIYEIIYSTGRKNLEVSLKEYPWINYYEKNFCVRITSTEHYDERYYAGFVWQSLERSTRPQVNLDNPNLLIEIFINKDIATVSRLLYQNFETFENRKAHLKPILHPTAMHPKMARALINVLNPAPEEKIIDPFCGACGILTEAGLLGVKFEGHDIDKKILETAKTNLEYYNISPDKYKLILTDSTKVKDLRNIVTDLPYGKSSKKSHELVELYARFLKNISGRAVIVMPSFMPYKALLDKNLPKSLTVLTIIDQYVHKSLTRKIIVIDRKSGAKKDIVKTKKIIQPVVKKKAKTATKKFNTAKKKVTVKKGKKIAIIRSKHKSVKKSAKHNKSKVSHKISKKTKMKTTKKTSIKKHKNIKKITKSN